MITVQGWFLSGVGLDGSYPPVPRRQSEGLGFTFCNGGNLVTGTNEYEVQIECGTMLEDYPEYPRYPVM